MVLFGSFWLIVLFYYEEKRSEVYIRGEGQPCVGFFSSLLCEGLCVKPLQLKMPKECPSKNEILRHGNVIFALKTQRVGRIAEGAQARHPLIRL